MRCSCCDKQRNELHPKKSKLMRGMTLHLCNDCIKAKREPRALVIIYGRKYGAESVSDYIRNHRYIGAEITAKELVS